MLVGLMLLTVLVLSCVDSENGSGKAHLVVRLTDAPGDYQQVNIDIQDVQVNTDADSMGWISLDINEGVYDLLKLRNGLDTLLGEADLPAGRISQVRLILGSENTVMVDSMMYDLATPSAQQSGLKVQVHANLEEGGDYEILLDFDAARSVLWKGNGNYQLKPVIRAIVKQTGGVEDDGAIQGTVSPAASNPAVHVIQGLDTVSTMSDSTGGFFVGDLAPGTYRIVFVPAATFTVTEVTNIAVTAGDTTSVGTVVINPL